MTKLLTTYLLLATCSVTFAKEILLECGTATRNPFNGWSVHPYNEFSAVTFGDESIDFFAEKGGDYTLSLTRRIEAMADYDVLDLTLQVDAVENCVINQVDLYLSADGRKWTAVPVDQQTLTAIAKNPDHNYKFVRYAVNVSFKCDGYLRCSYFKMEGENEPVLEETPVETEAEENSFFVFCFNRSINVETKNEKPYEIVFTNLAGQVVYSETGTGSVRIETELPEGIYVVAIVQDGEIKHTRKVTLVL